MKRLTGFCILLGAGIALGQVPKSKPASLVPHPAYQPAEGDDVHLFDPDGHTIPVFRDRAIYQDWLDAKLADPAKDSRPRLEKLARAGRVVFVKSGSRAHASVDYRTGDQEVPAPLRSIPAFWVAVLDGPSKGLNGVVGTDYLVKLVTPEVAKAKPEYRADPKYVPEVGDTALLFAAGLESFPVATDYSSYDDMVKAYQAGDEVGIRELIEKGNVVRLPEMTQVLILEIIDFSKPKAVVVRLQEGKNKDRKAYTCLAWVMQPKLVIDEVGPVFKSKKRKPRISPE